MLYPLTEDFRIFSPNVEGNPSKTIFFGSSLAHLEPGLELFEVDAIGDDDDLSHGYLPNFKQL